MIAYKYLFFLLGVACFSSQSLGQQKTQRIGDFIESTSYNDDKRGVERTLQYHPNGEAFVCVNGTNKYTRALYGGHTPFRLETSDRPLFATYDKQNSHNIRFFITVSDTLPFPLDEMELCKSSYIPGKRIYELSDPRLGEFNLEMVALALYHIDGAIWRIVSKDLHEEVELTANVSHIKAHKLNRNGDMGADPADAFEASLTTQPIQIIKIKLDNDTTYLQYRDFALCVLDKKMGNSIFTAADQTRQEVASRVQILTPDPYLNTLGGALSIAADGIWSGEVWLHGAVGWRMPLNGWRAAYTGDVLGWKERARTHFDAYAASQVTNVTQTVPHPAQDSLLHLARSVKKWGTPQYSNGYICRNPNRSNQMHHYDMNLCYMDELMWHFKYYPDTAYMRKMWPTIKSHLAWEKLNYDPNDDALYDAYASIWASDALYYNSGAVTHSSAYNYRANKYAALIAKIIGEDATPYEVEASRILKAINQRLWLADKGHWAEYQDLMGHQRLHESAGVWTIYHAIDSEIADPFQAYQAMRYVDTAIPHIPVAAEGLDSNNYATISTTNWLPYSWSINNVAFAEVMHTALAYFQAGCYEKGYRLLKSSVLDGMYLGNSPGNFGQISFYDAARGECYRDFGDPIGIASRVLMQGLFGILPDGFNDVLYLQPGFPIDWNEASIVTPDVAYVFQRNGLKDCYIINQSKDSWRTLKLRVKALSSDIKKVMVNGKVVNWHMIKTVSERPIIEVVTTCDSINQIEIEWAGDTITPRAADDYIYQTDDSYTLRVASNQQILDCYDPQCVLDKLSFSKRSLKGKLNNNAGSKTFFILLKQGAMEWWQPIDIMISAPTICSYQPFSQVVNSRCDTIGIQHLFNSNVSAIFQNEYLSPRSPYTTLQIPKQGIGEWCHPLLSAEIDDSGIRNLVVNGQINTALNVPFATPQSGANIIYTSLWDNYPDSVTIALKGKATNAYLLLAGSTNHMQCHIANGVIRIYYTDGSCTSVDLINPDNWCPIEQDYYVDGMAFQTTEPSPYRLHLKSGLLSNDLGKALNISGVYGRTIEGGAGVLLDIPLDKNKELNHLQLESLSNDVVIGLMSITLQR